MSDERPTVRPVTLGRLVELTHMCEDSQTTTDVEERLGVSHSRARETILEALRINLIAEGSSTEDEDSSYQTTSVGEGFLSAVRCEAWQSASDILRAHSPHYKSFLEVVEEAEARTPTEILAKLEDQAEFTPYTYNQTSLEVLGDWAERLGTIQRNAFTNHCYPVTRETVPTNFPFVLLSVYDELEETAGVNLRQRHLSIPKLREHICQRIECPRECFDDAVLRLVSQNVGKVELSGAPLDTAAKDSPRGIRRIELTEDDSLVSTSQTTDRVMSGVEQFGKQYYYLAVYDRDLTFRPEENQ